MNRFYCVETVDPVDEPETARMFNFRDADTQPEDQYFQSDDCATYLEWFGSEEEANDYIKRTNGGNYDRTA